jgi:hypothetical protein
VYLKHILLLNYTTPIPVQSTRVLLCHLRYYGTPTKTQAQELCDSINQLSLVDPVTSTTWCCVQRSTHITSGPAATAARLPNQPLPPMFSNFCFATFADHKIIGVCNHSIVTLYKRIIMTSFDVDDPARRATPIQPSRHYRNERRNQECWRRRSNTAKN